MIKFGTDGWRGIIADDFTIANVKLVTQAIVNYLKSAGLAAKGLVIGYDNRFFSERFAREAARVAAGNQIKVWLTESSAPSPAVSFAVKSKTAAGAIMITASHNPPQWNGLKFKTRESGSAPLEVTQEIERQIQLKPEPAETYPEELIVKFNPKIDYFSHLETLVDLPKIADAKIKVVVDPMHGSSAGYLHDLLAFYGLEVIEINNTRDPLFGGINPEPLPGNLEELTSLTKEITLKDQFKSLCVGLALDGDGDRLGAVDSKGSYINPHQIFAILLKHLVEYRKLKGNVVKTFNITELINKMVKTYDLKLNETPIGFKYICDLMLKADILIGGEESGGIGIKGHIPERDGILAGLLLLEAMAVNKKSLGELMDDLNKKYGPYFYNRSDLRLPEEKKKIFMEKLKASPPAMLAKLKVSRREDLDGQKFYLEDGSWILFRPSGTEPLLRIYAEGGTEERVDLLLAEGEKLATS